ncbi:unnamed protein product [Notodromas monacha]|uniref:Host cell factor Kelch-repeats domain-containing protein n=1 Tax=Notodromas monacha TaxID=399045 RepID=A0A7R9GGI1_9CRUS|nr:unnamed protein product [Notodromas monacha]CAG0919961.1 unnamed protein product [Notodromas monacha]
MASTILRWKRVKVSPSPEEPVPRHGHRGVVWKDYFIIFGGGNEGIYNELHVFDFGTHQWFSPDVTGDIPPGCASHGFVTVDDRIFLFGGTQEYGKHTNEMYELQIRKWRWKFLDSPSGETPSPRFGHSLTVVGKRMFLFGGLANSSESPVKNVPVYLDDFYTVQVMPVTGIGKWTRVRDSGKRPSARESHSAVAYQTRDGKNKLVIYGGMNGVRLGDVFIFDVETTVWKKPGISGLPPLQRSLHSAVVVGHIMHIFGGWVPLVIEDPCHGIREKEWRCSNSFAALNLDTLHWESFAMDMHEESLPIARAGHVCVAVDSRLYIWSGRDGFKRSWNKQVCLQDFWSMDTRPPEAPLLLKATNTDAQSTALSWTTVRSADRYLVQIQKDPTFSQAKLKVAVIPKQGNVIKPVPVPCSSPPNKETHPLVVHSPDAEPAKKPKVMEMRVIPAKVLKGNLPNLSVQNIQMTYSRKTIQVQDPSLQNVSMNAVKTNVAPTSATPAQRIIRVLPATYPTELGDDSSIPVHLVKKKEKSDVALRKPLVIRDANEVEKAVGDQRSVGRPSESYDVGFDDYLRQKPPVPEGNGTDAGVSASANNGNNASSTSGCSSNGFNWDAAMEI